MLAEVRQLYADLSARDWEAFAEHFWPNATITTVWQPRGESKPRVVVSTIDEFVAKAPQGPGSKSIFEEKMVHAKVRIHGNLAEVWSRFAAKFGEPGDLKEWEGIDSFNLMKVEGRWKVVSIAFAADE